ncbi:MAG: SHOCT domain-containing protein [Clostridia bacterium]|nr:SHOCT domain-containing protein [Clostridia bacterium]
MALFKKEKDPQEKNNKGMDLTNVVTTAIQIPGVKVSRDDFLREQFKELSPAEVEVILQKGPVEAGCSRALLERKAGRIIKERTAISTGASFVAGIPGGLAMAATIPADLLQFYGVALRMAQELVYLYGEMDIWCDGVPDPDRVTNQLILYCGVMLGVSGAAQTVRLMSSALAKQALKKLPQMALTKTFYYPVIKSIVKFFGISLTKSTFAKGVSKVIPVVGGVVSGGITLASMLPMGNRLAKTLDEAHYTYTNADFEADWCEVSKMNDSVDANHLSESTQQAQTEEMPDKGKAHVSMDDSFEKIQKAKQMLDAGIITEEEFSVIKKRLLSQL